jgi:hypothetical protein
MKNALLPVLGLALLFASSAVINYTTVETVQVVVESKERMTTGTGENRRSFWIVFTDQEVFANKDNIWFAKFNSSDIQRQLVDGQACQVKVNGFRVPFLSMYRNVLKVEGCRPS